MSLIRSEITESIVGNAESPSNTTASCLLINKNGETFENGKGFSTSDQMRIIHTYNKIRKEKKGLITVSAKVYNIRCSKFECRNMLNVDGSYLDNILLAYL